MYQIEVGYPSLMTATTSFFILLFNPMRHISVTLDRQPVPVGSDSSVELHRIKSSIETTQAAWQVLMMLLLLLLLPLGLAKRALCEGGQADGTCMLSPSGGGAQVRRREETVDRRCSLHMAVGRWRRAIAAAAVMTGELVHRMRELQWRATRILHVVSMPGAIHEAVLVWCIALLLLLLLLHLVRKLLLREILLVLCPLSISWPGWLVVLPMMLWHVLLTIDVFEIQAQRIAICWIKHRKTIAHLPRIGLHD